MKRILTLIGVLLFLGNSLFGQQIRVTGIVTDLEDGSTLPGVTVIVKGTTIGAITDANGRYEINVQPTATLVYSFIGLRTVEIPVDGRTLINVALERDVFSVEEFVVVGYGIQQRRDISGAVSTVKGESIRTVPIQTFEQALQGKAAGVNVTIPNAVLGNPPVIRVRGYNSISGSSSPLFIVDGVPVVSGDASRGLAAMNLLGDINPSDIESIEILKDASATAIYGSRAANGVVLITTRRGALGKTTVTYDASVGMTTPSRIYEMMNAEQFVEHKNMARANMGLAPSYFLNNDADGKLIDTDWMDVVYRTGLQHNHSLTFSGATPATRYFASVGYSFNEGIVQINDYSRKSARLNIEHKLNKAIQLSANFSYTNSFSNAPNTGSIPGGAFNTAGVGRVAFLYAPNVPLYVDTPNAYPVDGQPGKYYNIGANGLMGTLNNTQSVGFFHPQYMFDKNYSNAQNDRIIGNVSGSVEFFPGLVFRTVFGLDNSNVESKTFYNPLHGDGQSRNGDAMNYFDRRNRWNWTNTLNFVKTFGERLNLNVLVGTEEQYTQSNGWSAWRQNIADIFFTSFQGSFTVDAAPPTLLQTENYFNSFFGRFNMNFDQKYYVEVSGRRDGFSGLGVGNKYGNFGGASVMWNLSREDFIRNSIGDIFSDLRIKGSYGRVGNISGIANFGSLSLYSAGRYDGSASLALSQAGNPDLAWETSNKFDAGIAFGLLSDRIQFDINYYYNLIDGLILDVPQAPSKGIPNNTVPANVGSMYNTGLEATITTYNVQSGKFSWVTTVNMSTLKNEVTELAPGVDEILGVTAGLETTNRTVVGSSIGSIWGVKTLGVDPATGRRMFQNGSGQTVYFDFSQPVAARWTLADGTTHRAINITDDGQVLGSPLPKFYGGMDNTFTYGNFDANVGLTFATGFYVYNGSKAGLRDQRTWNNSLEVYEKVWKNPGDVTDIPKAYFGDNVSNGSTMVQSQNVEKGDFLKLRNLSIGYRLDNDFTRSAGISSLRLYVQMFNILTLTKYTGADPEISTSGDTNIVPGVDRNTVPQARTVTFGINLVF